MAGRRTREKHLRQPGNLLRPRRRFDCAPSEKTSVASGVVSARVWVPQVIGVKKEKTKCIKIQSKSSASWEFTWSGAKCAAMPRRSSFSRLVRSGRVCKRKPSDPQTSSSLSRTVAMRASLQLLLYWFSFPVLQDVLAQSSLAHQFAQRVLCQLISEQLVRSLLST